MMQTAMSKIQVSRPQSPSQATKMLRHTNLEVGLNPTYSKRAASSSSESLGDESQYILTERSTFGLENTPRILDT